MQAAPPAKRKVSQKEKPEAEPKPMKRFWPPLATIALTVFVYFASQFLAAILINIVPMAAGWTEARTTEWLQTTVAQFLLISMIEGFVVLMLWGLLHMRRSTFRDIGLSWPRLKDVGYAVLGFGMYFLLYLIIALLARLLVPSINFEQQQQIGFETARQHGPQLILVFISLVLLPPFVEEVLARGFLYTGLKTKWPVWAAAVVTSLIFAAAHLEFGSGAPLLWVAAIDTFTLSLVLIYLREKTGKLGASIMLHMLKNGVAFVLLFIVGIR